MSESSARPLRLVLLGPPASGKGTQGKRLAAAFGAGYLSTGALLREEIAGKTPLGGLAEPILARGEYLPDDLMCRILAGWLSRQKGGWVLDGFPRSLPQAGFLDQWLEERGFKLDCAIVLEVPLGELLLRIHNRVECPQCRWSGQRNQAPDERCPSCGTTVDSRPDDNEENFLRRHAEFERLTIPVVDHYEKHDVLFRCDATAPRDQVAAALRDHIGALA